MATLLSLHGYGIFSFCSLLELTILSKGLSKIMCINIAIAVIILVESMRRLPVIRVYVLCVERITSFLFHFLLIYMLCFAPVGIIANL